MSSSKPSKNEADSAYSSSDSDSDQELWIRPPQAQASTSVGSRSSPHRSVLQRTEDSDWAARPGHGDIYEKLDDFFPDYDLDKPLPEESDNTSARKPITGRKSIRNLAEEYKRDRAAGGTGAATGGRTKKVVRKTKLWGSKVEDHPLPRTGTNVSGSLPLPPISPDKRPVTFKWIRGDIIGRGTYDRVYFALNASTGEMMAVKQVDLPAMENGRDQARQVSSLKALKREMETLEGLDHPNIVNYLGYEESSSLLSIFLEYVPGGSIGRILQKYGKVTEGQTILFTKQILEGLEYLHSNGIIHMNLTSDNVLLDNDGTCKISDFGLSRRTSDLESEGPKLQGAVFWMAPELLAPQKNGTPKADIWSTGCLFLEMISGRRPWSGENTFAVMFQIYQKKMSPPVPEDTELSELAVDFKTKCFAIDPDERPSAKELLDHEYLKVSPGQSFIGLA